MNLLFWRRPRYDAIAGLDAVSDNLSGAFETLAEKATTPTEYKQLQRRFSLVRHYIGDQRLYAEIGRDRKKLDESFARDSERVAMRLLKEGRIR